MCRAGAVLALVLGVGFAAGARADDRPDIVLMMSDDQGWGDVGYNGHDRLLTPRLDQMAAEGVRFDRFYAASPLCSPTRAGMLTGRTPNRIGVLKHGWRLRPQEITLAQLLRDAGYVTGHFGKWHIGAVSVGGETDPGSFGFVEWMTAANYFDFDPILSDRGRAVRFEGEGSAVVAELAIDFLRRHADRPKLAVIWFGNPHWPHLATAADRAPYAGLPEEEQHFLGEITAMDRAVGMIRDALDELGLRENTLFWFMGDNGGLAIGRRGGRGRKTEIYEGGLRVPAVLEWPRRLPAPQVFDTPASTSDVLPTALEAAGVAPPDRPLDGASLLPALETGAPEPPLDRPLAFWEFEVRGKRMLSDEVMPHMLAVQATVATLDPALLYPEARDPIPSPEDEVDHHAALIRWPWKLHRIDLRRWHDAYWDFGPTIELYHLADDPMEARDLSGDEPDRADAMLAELEEWQESVRRSLAGADYR